MRSRRARDAERAVEARARELLAFVGLEAAALSEASTLPYGQQRLLEIARSLAARRGFDQPAFPNRRSTSLQLTTFHHAST